MDGKDELHRVYAVRAMANMERSKAERALREALHDPSTMVRRQAALLLEELSQVEELSEEDLEEVTDEELQSL